MLEDTRKSKTEKEVEDEFRQIQEKKLFEQKTQNKQSPAKPVKKQHNWDLVNQDDTIEEAFGIKKEKSQCLLL